MARYLVKHRENFTSTIRVKVQPCMAATRRKMALHLHGL
jgi:hypothetical protein